MVTPPPGAGEETVTGAMPSMDKLSAETEAVSLVPSTYSVGIGIPRQRTTEAGTNPVPCTVTRRAAVPTGA